MNILRKPYVIYMYTPCTSFFKRIAKYNIQEKTGIQKFVTWKIERFTLNFDTKYKNYHN